MNPTSRPSTIAGIWMGQAPKNRVEIRVRRWFQKDFVVVVARTGEVRSGTEEPSRYFFSIFVEGTPTMNFFSSEKEMRAFLEGIRTGLWWFSRRQFQIPKTFPWEAPLKMPQTIRFDQVGP